MIMQVVAGEGGVNAVSCQCGQAPVIKRARSRSPVPLNNRERHSLWVELFLVGLERPATLSESRDVSVLDRMLLREYVWGGFMMMTVHGSFVSVNKAVAAGL